MQDFVSLQPIIPMPERQPAKRRRQDLQLPRVLLALVVAPLLGGAIMTALFYLAGTIERDESVMLWDDLAMSAFSPSVWSLVCGFAYLQTMTRLRGQIARHECLLLGFGSSFLFPSALFSGMPLLHGAPPQWFAWGDFQYLAMFGLICAPFGVFGGWLFWRLGIRPAKAPTTDFAAVFD